MAKTGRFIRDTFHSFLLNRKDTKPVRLEVLASKGREVGKVTVDWKPEDDLEEGSIAYYLVYRAKLFGGFFRRVSGKQLLTSWDDIDLNNGEYYWYQVRAFSSAGLEARSQTVKGWAMPDHAANEGGKGVAKIMLQLLSRIPHWFDVGRAARSYQLTPQSIVDDYIRQSVPSEDEMMDWIESVCKHEHRRIGSAFAVEAEEYILQKLNDISESTSDCVVGADAISVNVRTVEDYGLRIRVDDEWEDVTCFYANNTGFTPENAGGTIEGKMVYVGEGRDEDFALLIEKHGRDLSDKILVIDTPIKKLPIGALSNLLKTAGSYQLSDPNHDVKFGDILPVSAFIPNFGHDFEGEPRNGQSVYWKANDLKAGGIIAILRDYPGAVCEHWGPYGDKALDAMPAMFVDKITGEKIVSHAEDNRKAEITLKGSVDTKGKARNIYMQLPGLSDETILVSTHHDAPFKGATEDGTGIAMVLAMAKAWAKVPLEKRTKTILFHLSAGHFYAGKGAKEFSRMHKDGLLKNAIVNINLEHLAARGVKEDEETHKLVVDGDKTALTLMWISEDLPTIAATRNMLSKYEPRLTSAIPGNLLGAIPVGESGHYHRCLGIPYINYLGGPRYLLCSDDTLDKVYRELLVPSALQSAELIASYMTLREGYDLWNDPHKTH